MEQDEAEDILSQGTVWRPTWRGISVDLTEYPDEIPMDWAEMTKQDAIELSETLVEKYRYSKPDMIEDIGFQNLLTGERLTIFQMLRRKKGV